MQGLIILSLSLMIFLGCGGTPGVIQPSIDPNTIADAFKYDEDLKACNTEAYSMFTCGGKKGYLGNATASGMIVGCPGGIIVGAAQAAKNEPLRREHVEQCMAGKGYKVLGITTSRSPQVSPPSTGVTAQPAKVTASNPSTSPQPTKASPAVSSEQLSIENRLQKLMELRQKKLITEAEYEKAKNDVLKKLTE